MKIEIDQMLKQKQRTRYWLAKQTGVAYQNMVNLCEGKTSSIRFDLLEKICSSLDCTPNDILKLED